MKTAGKSGRMDAGMFTSCQACMGRPEQIETVGLYASCKWGMYMWPSAWLDRGGPRGTVPS